MSEVKTQKANRTLLNLICATVVAVIATAASYDYWHDTNIRVTFQADNEKELNYQVYYTEDYSGRFNGKQSARQVVPAGSNYVKIVLPSEKVGRLRLDTGRTPGHVVLKDIKVSGDETVEFTDYDNYVYHNISDHSVNEDGNLEITSDHIDPYIITTEELEIYPGDDYDWLKMWSVLGGAFIIAFLLAMLINRKK